jgi:O-methyltransferase involved in polyketide biosynthesis
MYPKKVVYDTAQVLQSYLTYQAVHTIIHQLSETNPGQSIWLSQYTASQNIQDSETFLEGLIIENKELMLRIMTVREYLAQEILDFLPEIVRSGIQQSNMEHRRQLLERLTQPATSNAHPEFSESDLRDSSDSS